MRYITDTVIYLNQKQAEEFLGNNEPGDIEFFEGQHARASYAKNHEGLYITLYTIEDDNH